jgi:hypothetical protein
MARHGELDACSQNRSVKSADDWQGTELNLLQQVAVMRRLNRGLELPQIGTRDKR